MPDVLVFRRVRAVDPSRKLDAEIDVVVERKLITRVGPRAAEGLVASDRIRVFDAPGCLLLPGLVDLHAHLREPGQEYKEDIAPPGGPPPPRRGGGGRARAPTPPPPPPPP